VIFVVDQIKKLCAEHKTTVKSLEKELGFGNGTIRRWDTNAPSAERISMVANRFNVPMSYLMGETDDPSDRSKTHWAELAYGQKEKPTLQAESERIPGYSDLSATNKAIVDSMIAQLLAAQLED
jgi:transcriptional regulator with XRE-family HTH domain